MTWTQKKRKLLKKIKIKEDETKHGISFKYFEGAPNTAQLRDADKGKRVWIASFPRTKKIHLINISNDVIGVQFQGEVPIIYLYSKEVILHPKEWNKERFND